MKDNLFDTIRKKDLQIFEEEFDKFLPDKIIDSHIHLWESKIFKKEIFDGFRIEDFQKFVKKVFPGKKYDGIFFGLPVKEADLNVGNRYISDICKKNNSYGLFNPEAGLKEIPQSFFEERFIGFKPYPD